MSDRRHLVADRNRRDHDLAAPRRNRHHTGHSDASLPGRCCRRRHHGRQTRAARFRRISRHQASLAVNAANGLGRSRSLQTELLVADTRHVFTGDGARKDKNGYFWIMGRVDDVLNVSGHRLSTMEVESALVAHPKVAEAAVVGRPDELKGQAISAFVTLEMGNEPTDALKEELKKWVAKEIGALARPDDIRFSDTLPKTRSGKIMRRLLRELATSGDVKGDVTTLEDFTVIAKLRESDE
jgi:acyl-CoA synthetase (AMP-forming)/AMP-acid ligase II